MTLTVRIWEIMLMLSVMMVMIMMITTTMTRQINVRDDVEDGGEGLFITKFRWRSLLGVTMWPTYYNFLMYSHQHFQKLHSMLLKAKKNNWWCCCPGKTHTLPIIINCRTVSHSLQQWWSFPFDIFNFANLNAETKLDILIWCAKLHAFTIGILHPNSIWICILMYASLITLFQGWARQMSPLIWEDQNRQSLNKFWSGDIKSESGLFFTPSAVNFDNLLW